MDGLIILISANSEWRAVRSYFPDIAVEISPFGEWFTATISPVPKSLAFFHGG
jgi:hypothetical protein